MGSQIKFKMTDYLENWVNTSSKLLKIIRHKVSQSEKKSTTNKQKQDWSYERKLGRQNYNDQSIQMSQQS